MKSCYDQEGGMIRGYFSTGLWQDSCSNYKDK